MSKLYRSSAPPAGAFEPLRNTRLYGDRDTQIETASLRQRGTPNTDRAYVGTRKRADLRAERAVSTHLAHLQAAQTAMLEAQRAVRAARQNGASKHEVRALAYTARTRRAEYLKLTGGVERRAVETAASSASWDESK